MRTTINFPTNLLQGAKAEAKRNGMTLSDFVVDVVRAALAEEERRKDPVGGSLPVFDCGGPALVDLNDKKALWEVLDDRP